MCRFALYLGPPIRISSLVTEPTHSIIQQSYRSREREEPLNGDGFGLAWYADRSEAPAVLKEVNPAWSSVNLLSLARATHSGCIMAHVRAASPGLPVTQLNCHPFAHGRFGFMHNGFVGQFRDIVRRLRAELADDVYHDIQGSTDSEHVFALAMEAHARRTDVDPADRMAAAVVDAIGRVERLRAAAGVHEPAQLNLALTDGRRAVVTRYVTPGNDPPNSLYVHTGRAYVCEEGACRMIPATSEPEAVLVASEPLSGDAGWDAVPVNHMLIVGEDRTITTTAIG